MKPENSRDPAMLQRKWCQIDTGLCMRHCFAMEVFDFFMVFGIRDHQCDENNEKCIQNGTQKNECFQKAPKGKIAHEVEGECFAPFQNQIYVMWCVSARDALMEFRSPEGVIKDFS